MKFLVFSLMILSSTIALAAPTPAPAANKAVREEKGKKMRAEISACKQEVAPGGKKKLTKEDRLKFKECLQRRGVIKSKK